MANTFRSRRVLIVLFGLALSTASLAGARRRGASDGQLLHQPLLRAHRASLTASSSATSSTWRRFRPSRRSRTSGIVAEAGHPSLDGYLARQGRGSEGGLVLELNGQRLLAPEHLEDRALQPGSGRSADDEARPRLSRRLLARLASGGAQPARLRDGNFPDRAGWKEVVAESGSGVALAASSVPAQDRSRQLTDYPTDLMNSPPQIGAGVADLCGRSSMITAARAAASAARR